MTLVPLLNAPLVIQVHVAFALPALIFGPIVLFRSRRDWIHRTLGYAWVLAMLGLALSAVFIRAETPVIGAFGPIHLLVPVTLWGLFDGMRRIWAKDVVGHQAAMRSLWFGAIGIAGLFTLAPGRVMHHVLFGQTLSSAWIVIAVGLIALAALWWRVTPRKART